MAAEVRCLAVSFSESLGVGADFQSGISFDSSQAMIRLLTLLLEKRSCRARVTAMIVGIPAISRMVFVLAAHDSRTGNLQQEYASRSSAGLRSEWRIVSEVLSWMKRQSLWHS